MSLMGAMIAGPAMLLLLLSCQSAVATSTPFVTQVAGPRLHVEEQRASESKSIDGFMEDIGFKNFFQDVGVEAAGSSPVMTHILPAASNQFPAFNFAFSDTHEKTKEQLEVMKERGFMPSDPFASASHLSSSNIAPPEAFKDSHDSPFGSASNIFQFPKSFHKEFDSFDFSDFGSGVEHKKVNEESEKKRNNNNNAAASDSVEHRPRGQSASRGRPRYAERRHDTFEDFFPDTSLYASSSKKEEKKNKGNCDVVIKDGMTCEVCNDGQGGFSEHCSHSQNSGKDSKFINNRKSTTDDIINPPRQRAQTKEAPAQHQQSQQQRIQQRQQPQRQQQHGRQQQHPADRHGVYDLGELSFGESPYAQSRQDKVYDRQTDPFEGFSSDPFDHFAEGVPANDARKQSGSQKSRVANRNLGYQPKLQQPLPPKDNFQQLGQMVDLFGKKNRKNCKKEIRKSMTCFICPNAYGQTDEECMFASNDPNGQHMMYTEESSYGNQE